MDRERNKKKLFMIGMSVLLILVLVIGGTYAWFTLQLNGTKVNVLKAGTLSLILNDENSVGINSEKAVPMLDEVGETLDPYHFTLENHGELPSEYTIYLDDIDLETDEVRMRDSFVKYQLTKDGTKTTALLNTLGEHPDRVLDSGTIDGNKTIIYDLRLWINSDATNEVMGTTLRTKIRVVATQSENTETSPSKTNLNILKLYSYSEDDATKCISSNESTCVEIKVAPETYTPGTIVKYQVNDTEEKYFHVIRDQGDTLILQQRENTISNTSWAPNEKNGPVTVLPLLEDATSGWTNVNDQKYTMGTTPFVTNEFTGCSGSTSDIVCTKNTYTLEERTAKARMITAQEAGSLGCKFDKKGSCPIFMIDYLEDSLTNGGSMSGDDRGYWTMSNSIPDPGMLEIMFVYDTLTDSFSNPSDRVGARAIIEINK